MLYEFVDLISKVTNLSPADDKELFAICGCFLFLVIINSIVGLIKNLFNTWR